MKKILLSIMTLALPVAVMAQQAVFLDNFANDATLSSSYLNINTVNASTPQWNFTANTALSLTTTATQKETDIVGQFAPVTLGLNEYMTLIVNFSSSNIAEQSGVNVQNGQLIFALDNSLGVSATSTGGVELGNNAADSTSGATANYIGYIGGLSVGTYPKVGTKAYAKMTTGGQSGAGTPHNNLAYYGNAGTTYALGGGGLLSSANGMTKNNDSYTLKYTILNAGPIGTQPPGNLSIGTISYIQLYDNTSSTMVDDFKFYNTTGGTPVGHGEGYAVTPTLTFDTFDFGQYSGNQVGGYNIDITSLEVDVPEPNSMVLFCGGMGLLALIRRLRR